MENTEITFDYIRDHVENETGVRLLNGNRKRNSVYARTIYAMLAFENIKKENGKQITKSSISRYLKMNHSNILNMLNVISEEIKEHSPEFYDIYVAFNLEHNPHFKNDYEEEMFVNDEFREVLNTVPEDKMDLFLMRIKPIAKMLNSHSTY